MKMKINIRSLQENLEENFPNKISLINPAVWRNKIHKQNEYSYVMLIADFPNKK